MSEPMTNDELMDLERRYLRDGVCPVSAHDVWLMARELLIRRADTKPAPIEQGTLRDEMAMQFAASMIQVLGSSDRPLRFGSNHPTAMEDSSWSKVTAASYRMADAMLAERAKEPKQP